LKVRDSSICNNNLFTDAAASHDSGSEDDSNDEGDTEIHENLTVNELGPIDRYSCAAHSLQLCLFYGIKNTLAVSGAFTKLLRLQKGFGHSQKARNELKSLGNLYIKFIRTRWGTWIDVVERYFQIRNNIIEVCFNSIFKFCSGC
jgi:hypothetical protein